MRLFADKSKHSPDPDFDFDVSDRVRHQAPSFLERGTDLERRCKKACSYVDEASGSGSHVPESERYAFLWSLLSDGEDCIAFGTRIEAYRFRLVDCADGLHEGGVYRGKVRIGLDGPLDYGSAAVRDKGMLIYDSDLILLARIDPSDYSAGALRKRIGECAVTAYAFFEKGGYWSKEHLYLFAVWQSDLSIPKNGLVLWNDPISCRFRSYGFYASVEAPEALSDLRPGERFEADLLIGDRDERIGISRHGCKYKFAVLPKEINRVYMDLIKSGYPGSSIRCTYRGRRVFDKGEWFVEVECQDIGAIRVLTRFRKDSGMDVRFGWDYERIKLQAVERPLAIPFGKVAVEYVAVPIPERVNPLIELRVDGTVVDSARYGRKENRKFYDFESRVGKKSLWAKLHYGNDDVPYLNVIWQPEVEE